MFERINWVGVAAGIVTLVVLVLSFFVPWWQLTVGDNLLKVNASPVNTNFGLFGTGFRIPLLTTLNIISTLSLVASAVMMLAYSFFPSKPYSKDLLSFSYRKPLYSLIAFIVGLLIIISFARAYGFEIPLVGSSKINLPANFTMGATASVLVSAGFQFPFWLAIVATALCSFTRLYHGKIAT